MKYRTENAFFELETLDTFVRRRFPSNQTSAFRTVFAVTSIVLGTLLLGTALLYIRDCVVMSRRRLNLWPIPSSRHTIKKTAPGAGVKSGADRSAFTGLEGWASFVGARHAPRPGRPASGDTPPAGAAPAPNSAGVTGDGP